MRTLSRQKQKQIKKRYLRGFEFEYETWGLNKRRG